MFPMNRKQVWTIFVSYAAKVGGRTVRKFTCPHRAKAFYTLMDREGRLPKITKVRLGS